MEDIHVQQMHMQEELSTLQLRWSSAREEKINVTNTLSNLKKVEEELDNLAEEKSLVELDLKVFPFA